jgi:hypothetical protein
MSGLAIVFIRFHGFYDESLQADNGSQRAQFPGRQARRAAM